VALCKAASAAVEVRKSSTLLSGAVGLLRQAASAAIDAALRGDATGAAIAASTLLVCRTLGD
jgi:hypothetical protein